MATRATAIIALAEAQTRKREKSLPINFFKKCQCLKAYLVRKEHFAIMALKCLQP
jgi:hypothetical protein